MRRRPSRLLIVALSVLASTILAVSCGESPSNPDLEDPWAAVAPDLHDACVAAPAPSDGAAERDDYCRCIVLEFSEFFGTPEAFLEAGGTPGDGDRPADPRLEPAVEGCAEQYLR